MSEKLLSARESELWDAFKRMSETVTSRVASDVESHARLSAADFGVLSRLEDLGQGQLRQQELASSMGWNKSRLSHQLTRMQGRSLLKRVTKSDRSVLVSILPAGRKALAAARPVHAAAVKRHLLDRLKQSQAKAILDISSSLSPLPHKRSRSSD